MEIKYRAEATTLEGFIQQLAVGYLCRGYRFYFQGLIPKDKNPRAVDAKLIARYGLGISKFERAKRKAQGLANVQYCLASAGNGETPRPSYSTTREEFLR